MNKRLYLYVILVSFWLSPAQANETCIHDTLMHILRSTYDAPGAYHCGMCLRNSAELARKIRRSFGSHVPFNHVNILIIKHKDFSLVRYATARDVPFGDLVVGTYSRKPTKAHISPWKYHAVIEFRGTILDLDLAQPDPLPARRYFDTQFIEAEVTMHHPESTFPENRVPTARIHNRLEEIEVISVPAKDLLERFEGEWHYSNFDRRVAEENEFVERYPRESGTDFLARVREEHP